MLDKAELRSSAKSLRTRFDLVETIMDAPCCSFRYASALVALVVSLLSACGTVHPILVSGDATTIPPFKTFRIDEGQFSFATELTAEERSHTVRSLREAAVKAFKERGYEEAAEADVLVTLAAVSRTTMTAQPEERSGRLRAVDTSVLDAGRAPGVPEPEEPSGVGREGDLILFVLDPKTQRVLWRASSSGAATTPAEALRNARATYAAMVAKLPRAAGSTK